MSGLSTAPQLLTWGQDAKRLRAPVERDYQALLYATYRQILASRKNPGQEPDSPGAGGELLQRVLLAPRSASRLLWSAASGGVQTRRFIEKSLRAEWKLSGAPGSPDCTGWTADCRARISRDGQVFRQPELEEGIPIDLMSPHARSLDLQGGSLPVTPPRRAVSAESRRRAVFRIRCAYQKIRASGDDAAGCLRAWIRTIVVQPEEGGKFASGSNGQYVGRVMLVNAHNETSSSEDLADALVHEAIHGYLYMHESVQPWVRDFELYTDKGEIISPWSGALLPVRPFMQACFVWYGLSMFWAQQLDGPGFERARSLILLNRALRGFTQGSLVDRLQPWSTKIEPELLETIATMQSTVLQLLD